METKGSFESCRALILENIGYDVLASDPHVDREQLDEIVNLLQETVCSTRSRIRIAGRQRLPSRGRAVKAAEAEQ